MRETKRDGIIIRLTETSGGKNTGLYLSPFDIYVNTDLLRPGCTLQPITVDNSNYPKLVIQDNPIAAGKGFKHQAMLMTDNPDEYLPSHILLENQEFEYTGFHFPQPPIWGMWVLNYVKL